MDLKTGEDILTTLRKAQQAEERRLRRRSIVQGWWTFGLYTGLMILGIYSPGAALLVVCVAAVAMLVYGVKP